MDTDKIKFGVCVHGNPLLTDPSRWCVLCHPQPPNKIESKVPQEIIERVRGLKTDDIHGICACYRCMENRFNNKAIDEVLKVLEGK